MNYQDKIENGKVKSIASTLEPKHQTSRRSDFQRISVCDDDFGTLKPVQIGPNKLALKMGSDSPEDKRKESQK